MATLEQVLKDSLSGKLDGLQFCYCGYDCRVFFSIELDAETNSETIVLLDIGTHFDATYSVS